MRHSGNIFGSESYRGTGIRTVSGVTVTTMVLSLLSVAAAIYVVANFGELTAGIAIWMANFLSSGFPILVAILAVVYFVMRLKWKMRRRFWGW